MKAQYDAYHRLSETYSSIGKMVEIFRMDYLRKGFYRAASWG